MGTGAIRGTWRAGLLVVAFLGLALWAASSSASAHHNQPTCTAGGYTQTWNGPTTLANFTRVEDECILVHGDVLLPQGAFVHFIDTNLVFANNVSGNSTIHLASNSIFRMSDNDSNPGTPADRSGLLLLNSSNLTRGFFFNASVNATVHVNDTVIVGGGLPNNGLTMYSGLYFHSLADFQWNRVAHTTYANGVLLINYTKPGGMASYTVTTGAPPTPGAIGLYLSEVGNLTFVSVAPVQLTNGVLINDSQNITFRLLSSTASATGLVANRVTGLTVLDMTDTGARAVSIDLNLVVNATVQRAVITPLIGLQATYGIQLTGSRNISILDSDLANHALANLHTQLGTRELLVQNTTMRGVAALNNKGVWAQEAADIFSLSNFTFRAVAISSRGEGLNLSGVGGARVENSTLSTGVLYGLGCIGCFDVTFIDGTLSGWGTGVLANGDNLTVERSAVSGNTVGLLVADGSFRFEAVTFSVNTWSVLSTPAARLGPSSMSNCTVPAGSPVAGADAVRITGFDTGSSSRITFFRNNFTNPNAAPSALAGLRLSTIGRIDVVNNTFLGLSLNVTNAGTLTATGNTYRVSLLPLGAAVIFFDNSSTLIVAGETFAAPTPPLGLGTIVRASWLAAQADISAMRFPTSDYGVWISANPTSSLVTAVTVANVTASARRDAFVASGINTVRMENLTVDASTNAVIMYAGGNAPDLSLVDSFLSASGTAANFTAYPPGRVTAARIAVNRTGPTPSRVISLQGGSLATLSSVDVDGFAVGVVSLDVRRLVLTQQGFRNNLVGLRMDASSATSVVLNWTVTEPTIIENTSIRLTGDILVQSTSLTVRNASISVFALTSDPRTTRFFIDCQSTLAIGGGTNITTEPAFGGRIQESRFTIQLCARAAFFMNPSPDDKRSTLEGLGEPSSAQPEERGIYLQAAGATIHNVDFLNTSRPLGASGVALVIRNCTFAGLSGALAAATATAGASVTLSYSTVTSHDGVEATDSDVLIDNSSFVSAGIALVATNSRGRIYDTGVQFSSRVVEARSTSTVEACRVTSYDIFQAVYFADSGSAITVCDAYLDGDNGRDAQVLGGSTITFENTYVDRFNSEGRTYNVDSTSGTFVAQWTLQFAVCLLSDRSLAPGARINVTGPSGAVIYAGFSEGGGLTPALRFVEYRSQNGVEEYYAPMRLDVGVGTLSTSTQIFYRNQSVVEVCLDDVAPLLRILSMCPRTTASDLCEITVLASDEDSALKPGSPCFSFRGSACEPKGSSVPQASTVVTVTVILEEGENPFCFEAEDLYGNTARLCDGSTLDQRGPVVDDCTPGPSAKTPNATVELVCHISGSPRAAVFAGLIPSSMRLDPDGTLHATLTLQPGINSFEFSVNDSLGNLNKQTFAWTLDTQGPQIRIHTDLERPVNASRVLVAGSVSGDTVLLTFNGVRVNLSGTEFSFFWDVGIEGVNNGTFVALDDVGNEAALEVGVLRDTTTNCRLTAPDKGSQTGDSPVLVAGRCDADVVLTVNGIPVPVALDGSWSHRVNLASGPNTIAISGRDAHGATWYDEVRVFYVQSGPTSGLGVLIIFALLAVGALVAAFYISRRPRRKDGEEGARSMTGAQKAPPRPKPMTLKLPETPEDMTYRPPPPR